MKKNVIKDVVLQPWLHTRHTPVTRKDVIIGARSSPMVFCMTIVVDHVPLENKFASGLVVLIHATLKTDGHTTTVGGHVQRLVVVEVAGVSWPTITSRVVVLGPLPRVTRVRDLVVSIHGTLKTDGHTTIAEGHAQRRVVVEVVGVLAEILPRVARVTHVRDLVVSIHVMLKTDGHTTIAGGHVQRRVVVEVAGVLAEILSRVAVLDPLPRVTHVRDLVVSIHVMLKTDGHTTIAGGHVQRLVVVEVVGVLLAEILAEILA